MILSLFFLGFVLRIGVMFLGYHGDLNNNISWGTAAVERGLTNYYEGKDWTYSAPNQPPLTILMFAFLAWLWRAVDSVSWFLNRSISVFPSGFIWFWESRGMILLVKLPSILADMIIGALIYFYFKGIDKAKTGLMLSTLWILNPVVWYNSAVWGQTDSVVNLLGVISLIFLLKRKLPFFVLFFTLSLLFKGSLVIFIPLLIFIVLKQIYSMGDYLKSATAGLLTMFVISIWFHPNIDLLFWLINLYKDRIFPGEIGFLTANAFNFWWLIDSGRTLDSILILGIPARIVGFLLTLAMLWIVIRQLNKDFANKNILFALTTFVFATFLLMTRIHERYLYPFFPLATLVLGYYPKFTIIYLVISALHLVNLYHLFWVPSVPVIETYMINNTSVQNLLSVLNILFFAVFLYFYVIKLNKTEVVSS